jgi:hypothetical protein
MASFVTLLLYYKVIFLDLCLEYKHNDGMTFSPDLELIPFKLNTTFCAFFRFLGRFFQYFVDILFEKHYLPPRW